MAKYTNTGLVKHAKMALALKTKYMWGGILRLIEKQYDLLKDHYSTKSGTGYTVARWKELEALKNKGVYGVDCIGLIKSYLWSGKTDGGVGSPYYPTKTNGSAPDIGATDMFNRAKVKGKIADMPDIPGLIVYSKSHPHVGVYIGNGETIESTLGSRGDGVVKRKLDSFWEYYFQCPYIEYPSSTMSDAKTKKCTLAFPANVRSEPKEMAKKIGRYEKGSTVTIIVGSETKDAAAGYEYVRISGSREAWIVKSAIK